MAYQEVLIIGAPRSGTNALRDALCRFEAVGTWPCDEINPIWRHGNALRPTDELPAELARDEVRRYVNRRFARLAAARRLTHVVEKTCANSLRVAFVDRILPDARFVMIHRDPIDAVASAVRRWTAPVDPGYTLKKLRFVPLSDLPVYGWRFLANRLHRVLSGERRLATWGPRAEGMSSLLRSAPLPEVCAFQWNACAVGAGTALLEIDRSRVQLLRYEDLVLQPRASLEALAAFLGISGRGVAAAAEAIHADSVGRGRRSLSPEIRRRILAQTAPGRDAIARLLEALGEGSGAS